jgi:hypothetical protein
VRSRTTRHAHGRDLNFIPDPGTALREMSRVAQPGGTVAAAVWDDGQGMEMLRVFWNEAVALKPRPTPPARRWRRCSNRAPRTGVGVRGTVPQ